MFTSITITPRQLSSAAGLLNSAERLSGDCKGNIICNDGELRLLITGTNINLLYIWHQDAKDYNCEWRAAN